jgi:hypothetical protein
LDGLRPVDHNLSTIAFIVGRGAGFGGNNLPFWQRQMIDSTTAKAHRVLAAPRLEHVDYAADDPTIALRRAPGWFFGNSGSIGSIAPIAAPIGEPELPRRDPSSRSFQPESRPFPGLNSLMSFNPGFDSARDAGPVPSEAPASAG